MQGEPAAATPPVETTITEINVPAAPGGLRLRPLRRPGALERRRARRLRALRVPLLVQIGRAHV